VRTITVDFRDGRYTASIADKDFTVSAEGSELDECLANFARKVYAQIEAQLREEKTCHNS
jgi:hypothetical protein